MKTTRKRWHREDEEIWYLPESHVGPYLPLMIRHAGESQWRAHTEVSTVASNFFSIELVVAGNMHLHIDGKSYVAEKGEVFLLHHGANFVYGTGPAGHLHKLFIGIMGTMVDSIPTELGLTRCHVLKNVNITELERLCKRAVRVLVERPVGFLTEQSLIAYHAMLLIAGSIEQKREPHALSLAIDYLKNHIHQRLSVTDMIRSVGLGNAQLYRLFKKYIGEPPIEVFTKMKMEHAKTLLRHTPMQVKQIAFALGFKEPAYFANTFKKVIGKSPNAFRENASGPFAP